MSQEYPYQIIEANKHHTKMMQNKKLIIEEFSGVISKHSLENDSNTPNFILAEYLFDCLLAGQLMICKRSLFWNPEGNE